MEYYSAVNKNCITKSEGKWTELGGVLSSEVTQFQKEAKNSMFSLIWNPILLWSAGRLYK